MKMVLLDLFENLNRFGFERIYCINEHGDPVYIKTILDAIHLANETYNMQIKMLAEPYELCEYGLTGNEVDILVDYADYPMELFADYGGLLDIHAGAFETAAMKSFYIVKYFFKIFYKFQFLSKKISVKSYNLGLYAYITKSTQL